EVEAEFALQPLRDDLQVQQAKEAAAEAEAEGGAALGLVAEARVVEAQLADGLAQVLEIGGVDGKEAAEHDGLYLLEARQRLGARRLLVGHGIADARVGHLLDGRGEEA